MNDKQLQELLDSLTIKQKIGQLFQSAGVVFDQNGVLTGLPTYLDWLTDEMIENVGSILNIFDNAKFRRSICKKILFQ